MIISIIFIIIWCLLIISNIITLVELHKLKGKFKTKGGKGFAKTLGLKEKLNDSEKVKVVNIGIYNENPKEKKIEESIDTIKYALNLLISKETNKSSEQTIQDKIDIDKAERFLDKIIEEANRYLN